MTGFADALAAGPVTIDGGLGTLLETHGHDLSSALWSARLLVEQPAAIRRAHAEFYASGARVAITSSYQVGYDSLAAAGIDRSGVDALLRASVDLARDARDEVGLSPDDAWVAASVGPFGATRADGSEYTGAYGLSVAELRAWHRPRLQQLVAAAPDALAVETIPSLAELEAICAELEGAGLPAWVSVTVEGGRLRSGESLTDAAALVSGIDEVVAIGVNCCAVGEVAPALATLWGATPLPLVAYPNSGEQWHAETRAWTGRAFAVHEHVTQWRDAGARVIGGCCRVLPDEISRITRALDA